MTFNPMMAHTIMRVRKHFAPNPTVIEMGSQTLTIRVDGQPEIQTTPEFYGHLGFSRYDSLDMNGDETITWDLNVPGGPADQYDVVTNNGTGEHVFNQAAIFETIHKCCKPGGVMIHVLPWINWRNHGFYNFNPILFYDMAEDNGYEILDMFAGNRDGAILMEDIPPVEDKHPAPIDQNIMLVVAMRKMNDEPFKVPTQGKYREDLSKAPENEEMVYSPTIFDMAEKWEIFSTPYPHIIGKLSSAEVEAMKDALPPPEKIVNNREMGNNILLQLGAGEVLEDESISLNWRNFFKTHTSDKFLQDIVQKFGPKISQKYPELTKLPLKAGIRFRDNAPFQLDCQFAVNTPVSRRGTVRGPHLDDPKELYAGLLYLDGGGELTIDKWTGKRKLEGRKGMKKKAECAKGATQTVKTVKCEPGTFVFFLNTPDSIHGVAPREKGEGFRYYINLVGEVAEPLFELK